MTYIIKQDYQDGIIRKDYFGGIVSPAIYISVIFLD